MLGTEIKNWKWPPAHWKAWGRSFAFVSILGLAVSVAGFEMLRSWETQSALEEFHLSAATYEYAVGREIESNLGALRTLGAYLRVTNDVTSENFANFASQAMEDNPSILSLEWVPRLPGEGRAGFEQEMAARGLTAPYIRRNVAATPLPALAAPEYYPVRFVHPADNAESILGYDLASTPATRRLLAKAAGLGELVVGAKVQVVEKYHDGAATPSYLAIFNGPRAPENLRGYALAFFQMGEVLERGLRRLKSEPIDIQFYDLSAAPGKRFLYQQRSLSGAAPIRYASEAEALAEHDFKQVVRFEVGGRQWAMLMTATEAYKRSHHTWQPWVFFVIGLGITGIAAAYFFLDLSHTRRDEELWRLRSRKEAEDALRESEERYALAARGSKDGLWDWDRMTGRIYYSERWKSMLGYSGEEIADTPAEWLGRLYPGERERVELEIAAHCTGRTDHFQSEYRILHRDGTYRWMLSRGVAVLNHHGVAARVAGSQTDITENKSADHLTGLASRILLNEKLQLSIDRARADARELFAVLFLDLDRFKVINDSLGHLAGDRLLLEIANRLTACVDSFTSGAVRTTVARLGGDEFVVLIRCMEGPGAATELANQIQEMMKPAFDLDGRRVVVSTSIGVRIGDSQATPEILLRDADTAMYHAKAKGKQRYEVFVPAMRFRAVERLRLETDLRRAIENDELAVHYQPKVCLVTGKAAELEALVRWNHPERGLIFPSDFIALADETGLIQELGRCVLRQACAQMARWVREFDLDPAMRVSVNLSCKQFTQPDLFEQIVEILDRTGLAPSRLSLEITEGVLMENMDSAVVLLNRLRERKIGLQIDDFGTGFSSLNYLHRLPVDALKIDRSFVRDMSLREENAHIVTTIIMLARTLGMSVVAEGVEDNAQLRQLIEAGCDYAQGHLFSEAVDSKGALRFFDGFAGVLDAAMGAERLNA